MLSSIPDFKPSNAVYDILKKNYLDPNIVSASMHSADQFCGVTELLYQVEGDEDDRHMHEDTKQYGDIGKETSMPLRARTFPSESEPDQAHDDEDEHRKQATENREDEIVLDLYAGVAEISHLGDLSDVIDACPIGVTTVISGCFVSQKNYSMVGWQG